MNRLLSSFVIGSAVAMVGSPLSALAEQIPMDNPSWGYVLSGLGSKGLDTAYVFTNTTATMSWTAPDGVQSVELLVVGGGGAGGNGVDVQYGHCGGGGGGAGGYRYAESLSVVPNASYEVKVGGGATSYTDQCGGSSEFGDIQVLGGGCGGTTIGTVGMKGYDGGCGGGGSGGYGSSNFSRSAGGSGSDGCAGGKGDWGDEAKKVQYGCGGGGGGAKTAGADTPNNDEGGDGGAGETCGITGVLVTYAAGGGGASDGEEKQAGLKGGDGAGDGGQGTAGEDATGYGCGGGGGTGAGQLGGAGFQGIVVVRVNVREKEVVSMDDPAWGYKILGLGSTGHETVYVFTNTAAQMTWTAPIGTTTAELLVVGGGGAGGDKDFEAIGGGGGGAGGYRYFSKQTVSPGQSYLVAVGKGGLSTENAGGDSVFGEIVAKGGGRGACRPTGYSGADGLTGGSGGGASGSGKAGNGTSGQGNKGGTAAQWGGNAGTGGGGGGAGAVGGNAPNDDQSGKGGAGVTCTITGDAVVYCSGGGGGSSGVVREGDNGLGGVGAGDGGDGNHRDGCDATAYGCGGGGAAGDWEGSHVGGKGFQGVVIVRVVEHEWDWDDIEFSTCTEAGHSNAVCTIEGCTATAHLDIAPLGHDFSGLPDGDHVCTRDGCGVNAAVCPTIESAVYTGEAQKPDLTDDYFDADYGAETYVDAKTYAIKLTPKANTVWSDTQLAAARNVSYTITQAANEWTDDPRVSPDYWKVTAVPDEITIVNGSAAFGTVVCDKTVEDLKKLAAGTHQVNFTVAETANWAGLTTSVEIEIEAGIALDGTLDANTRTVSLNLGASSKPLALVLAYGATDEGGKLWNGWDSKMVLKTIAKGGASQYSYKMPIEGLGDGVKYIRFFLVDDQEPIGNAEIEGMSATFDFIPHVHDWSSYVDADGYRRFKCSDPDCKEVKRDKLDYTHLWSYLESDGKGYVKTDYVPNMDKTRVDVVYRHLDDGHFCLFEANSTSAKDKYANEEDGMMLVYWGVNPAKPAEVPSFTFYNYDCGGATFNYMPNLGVKHRASVFQRSLTFDGQVAQMSGGSYQDVQGPMVFFRHIATWDRPEKRTIITYSHGSIYSVKIYETENNVETLVHDYVPATKDGQNAGFWDRVENKYWPSTSAGFKAKTNGLSITIR